MNKLITKANQYIQQHKHDVNPRYRHAFHLMGEIGWINDPNGFSIFQDTYHLFYQYHPYDSIWGPMHWGHAVSKDLITWEHYPVSLAPRNEAQQATGGAAFSGSGFVYNNEHYLMYTENWDHLQVQNIAKSTDGIHYAPLSNEPVLTPKDLPDTSFPGDFRDPKVWKETDKFFALISSRAQDKSGQLLLYQSTDLHNWTFVNTVAKSNTVIGQMWECPDLFSLDNHDVLLVSPQYMPTKGHRFCNVHESIYMIGTLDSAGEFHFDSYEEIDSGFDFYAPQTILDQHGRRIMIAWMGMWERTIPTHDLGHKWAGAMTLPRLLSIEHGQLLQSPLPELQHYRTQYEHLEQTIQGDYDTKITGDTLELQLVLSTIQATTVGLHILQSGSERTTIQYDLATQTLLLDRSHSGHQIQGNPDYEPTEQIRQTFVPLINNALHLHLFIDRSSVELFINRGVKTMTALVHPRKQQAGIQLFTTNGTTKFTLDKWTIKVQNKLFFKT